MCTIIAYINLKIYDFRGLNDELERKADFKQFKKGYREKVGEFELARRKLAEKQVDLSESDEEEIGTIFEKLEAETEKEIIDTFLSSFVLDSDSGSKVD